ncbi:succinate dehydrogenase/fumarate reductase iron-sulfur subunit [candidate division KSB1 bacterium]|nr:succinate dehydrogenase/fumarate reductase iron-sulfur subunit [candidate division KSB1 bacterium]
MKLNLKIWRQKNSQSKGKMVPYAIEDVSHHMSFLEMLDVLNEDLIKKGEDPVEFDNDCREGICGMCSLVINGVAHGPQHATAVCQLHMRHFKDGQTVTIEPWRAKAFPVIKDLVVDRGAFDRIIATGGYISMNAGGAPDGNAIPISKEIADESMDAASCIGCGACVAACPNASASLFTAAKISQLSLLPQGQPEQKRRVIRMVEQMDEEGFGDCSNHAECEAVCPKEISIGHIARMKREYFKAMFTN